MRIRVGITAAVIVFACGARAPAKQKPLAPCKVYFVAAEKDGVTANMQMFGLNKPQMNWYKKHGDRKSFAGICYVTNADQIKDGAPVYAIMWGEHLVTEPYSYSYTTNQQMTSSTTGTVTDDNGNSSDVSATTTSNVPVTHAGSGMKHFYVADGVLARFDPKGGDGKAGYAPVAPLHNHNRTIVTSASVSLLKDALAAIRERELNILSDRPSKAKSRQENRPTSDLGKYTP
jgi:hypothetical protein